MRPPEEVMRLDRMGSAFQTRLSFMRSLVRRIVAENWQFAEPELHLDERGDGHAVYTVFTGIRHYSLIAFSHGLDPARRSDRVIANEWDATFNLFDGVPSADDIKRLAKNTPKQEGGRFSASELVLARANRSERLFQHVCGQLANGKQPDVDIVAEVGYVMRTTAVYGSGKFGCADRHKIAARDEFRNAFQAELLTVYLIRLFSLDLVEHIARQSGREKAVPLDRPLRRYFGIGNATGLGMAPFLINHQTLVHKWVVAKEEALTRVRAVDAVSDNQLIQLKRTLDHCRTQVNEWRVADIRQTERIRQLTVDLDKLADFINSEVWLHDHQPLNKLFEWSAEYLQLEAQEMTISLMLEPFADLVDSLTDNFHADEEGNWDPAMSLGELHSLIERHYAWVSRIGFSQDCKISLQWYYSEEKLEPRLGKRQAEDVLAEIPVAVGWDVSKLLDALSNQDENTTVRVFCAKHPEFRHVVRRVQTTRNYPYGEVADNVIADEFRPIDLLRFKLAFFGVSRFDPKSDLWTRVNMYQGAPFPDEFDQAWVDQWIYVSKPLAQA